MQKSSVNCNEQAKAKQMHIIIHGLREFTSVISKSKDSCQQWHLTFNVLNGDRQYENLTGYNFKVPKFKLTVG